MVLENSGRRTEVRRNTKINKICNKFDADSSRRFQVSYVVITLVVWKAIEEKYVSSVSRMEPDYKL